MPRLSPQHGGCWFCCTDAPGEWFFSTEFDTNLHKECLEQAIKGLTEEWTDPEVEIMAHEFGYKLVWEA